jgi:hypothetical protein
VHLPDAPLLPTAGGDLLLETFNLGGAAPAATWAGAPVAGVEVVRTSQGLRLRVPLPAGVGQHTLTLACKGHAAARAFGVAQLGASLSLSYSPPAILRVAPLRTEGGELTIFGENFGAAPPAAATALEGAGAGAGAGAADSEAAAAAAAAAQLQSVQVLVDGVPATEVRVKQAHKKLSCVAPAGVGIATVTVIVGGQACTADALHCAPEISALEPPDVDVTGGVLAIVGRSFGADAALVQVVMPDFGLEASDVVVRGAGAGAAPGAGRRACASSSRACTASRPSSSCTARRAARPRPAAAQPTCPSASPTRAARARWPCPRPTPTSSARTSRAPRAPAAPPPRPARARARARALARAPAARRRFRRRPPRSPRAPRARRPPL